KVHLFAFTRGAERYDEGRTIEPGAARGTFEAPCGTVGLSVCYDLRFPELYRGMGELSLLLVPAAFTATTGAAHWHLLLRARAVGSWYSRKRSRNAFFESLPVAVCGSSSTNTTSSGIHHFAILPS